MATSRVWFVVESGTDVRLVDGLAERYETTVLARTIPSGPAINRTPVPSVRVLAGPQGRLRFAAWAAAKILFGRPSPHFVLAQGYGLSALLAQLACSARMPSAMLVCSPLEQYYLCRKTAADPERPFRRSEYAAVRLLAQLNVRAGTHAIALSQYLAQTLEAYGAPLHIDIIPVYGVDVNVFRPSTQGRQAARAALGLPLDGSVVLFSSRIAPEKDVSTLLDAFARLRQQGRNLWLINRSGGHRQFLEQANRAGVAERVIATDAVHPTAELPLSYAAADVCVQASRAEGLGFAVLEALACETPVVASAVGGLREIVFDGETGWTCPPGNSAALATAIAEALDSTDEAARRASAGRQMVMERYERSRVFDRFARVIGSAIARDR
jgi:glycosyltransferase involved in cell wall biosynthesis